MKKLGEDIRYGVQYVYLHILNLNVVTPEFKMNIVIMEQEPVKKSKCFALGEIAQIEI